MKLFLVPSQIFSQMTHFVCLGVVTEKMVFEVFFHPQASQVSTKKKQLFNSLTFCNLQ